MMNNIDMSEVFRLAMTCKLSRDTTGTFDEKGFELLVVEMQKTIPFLDDEEKKPISEEIARQLSSELVNHSKFQSAEKVKEIIFFEIETAIKDMAQREAKRKHRLEQTL